MTIDLVAASSELVPEMSRIAYEAFLDVSSRHGFPPDFPNVEAARPAFQLLVDRSDYFGIVALVDGKPAGSNFLMKSDQVAAIGPLSVDPPMQGKGIGRMLMTAMLAHAAMRNYSEIRLLQDTFNLTSLALYTSLGFEVRDTVALIRTSPTASIDPTIRPLIASDHATIDRLCRAHYHTGRLNEIHISINYGFPAFVREKAGQIAGYYLPGLFGHGVFESEEDAIALITELARIVPIEYRKFLCPMRQVKLFQASLKAGWKAEKLLTYMSLGPYKPPTGVCTPSACY